MTRLFPESVNITNNTYSNRTDITKINLNYCSVINNSFDNGFRNCINLKTVTRINEKIINMSECFYNCSNLTNIPEIPNSVIDMSGTFSDCSNLTGNIVIQSENITNAYHCFYNTILDKNVVIPITYENGVNTTTYNTFIGYGYSLSERNLDGVLLRDINYDPLLEMWRYDKLDNGTKLLYEYLGEDINIIVPNKKTILNNYNSNDEINVPFYNNQTIRMVDLKYVPFVNNDMVMAFNGCNELRDVKSINGNVTNMSATFQCCDNLINVSAIPNNVIDMSWAFYNCSNLVNVPVIPDSVINLSHTFKGCSNLINAPVIPNSVTNIYQTFFNCFSLVNAPVIPNSVTDIVETFDGCYNLLNAPVIPNGVTNMTRAFAYCYNLVNVPEIPDSVINLYDTFYGCSNLVNAPEIPDSVNSMSTTFYNCSNLIGDIIIHSENITNTNRCFFYTTKEKDVYIPFKYNVLEDMYAWYESSPASGYPILLYTKSTSPLANTEGQVFYENGEPFTLKNIITTSANTYINFGNAYINYTRNISNDKINGGYTKTYNSFYANYGSGQNGVTLKDIDIITNTSQWTYTESNNIKILCNYIGHDTDIIIPKYKAILNEYSQDSTLFYNNQDIVNVDMLYINVVNNNISYAFYNCSNLSQLNNINKNISNISYAFYNCTNLVNTTEIPNSVDNMNHAFDGCNNISGNIYYNWDNINDVTEIYGNTSNTKNVYVNILDINGTNTQTYNSFINAGYSTDVVKDGVTLKDYQDYMLQDWNYDTTDNLRTLYYYTGNDINIKVPYKNTIINNYTSGTSPTTSNTPFYNNRDIITVDLANVPFVINSMYNAFCNCNNLTSIVNINQNVTNLANAFCRCSNLINAPEIPNSVTNMSHTFNGCSRLANAPEIPNSVTSLGGAFWNCFNLVNAPDMSNATNVTIMYMTFWNCFNLVNAPDMSNATNVTNMSYAFYGCSNLVGDITILSENIANVYQCFGYTTLEKNVYIPFQNNGVNTKTYNAFISAGYSIYEREDGVKLFDPNGSYINFNITPDVDTLKYLNGVLLENNRQITLTDNEYVLYNENYPIVIGHIAKLDPNEEYTVTKDLTSIAGYTITLNVDQTDCNVFFYINDVRIPAVVNGNNYSIALNTDEEINIKYLVEKEGYKDSEGTLTFNNNNITENIIMEAAIWTTWTRPNLTEDGTLGESSTAVSATRYSSQYAYYAMDSSTSTYWRPSSTGTVTYTLYNPKKLKITNTVFTFSSTIYRASSVTIQGSNDNTNWEDITSSYSGTTTGTLDMLSNTRGYKYYKFSLVTYSSAIRLTDMTFTAQELQN